MSSVLLFISFKTGSSLSFLSILCSFCLKSTASSSALNMPSGQERSNLISNPHFFFFFSCPQTTHKACEYNHVCLITGKRGCSDWVTVCPQRITGKLYWRSFFPPPLGSEMRLKIAPWSWRFSVLLKATSKFWVTADRDWHKVQLAFFWRKANKVEEKIITWSKHLEIVRKHCLFLSDRPLSSWVQYESKVAPLSRV